MKRFVIVFCSLCLILTGCSSRSAAEPQDTHASAGSSMQQDNSPASSAAESEAEVKSAAEEHASQPESSLPEESQENEPPAEVPGDWKLVLVNYNHPLTPQDYTPELARVQDSVPYQVDVRILAPAQEMIAAAKRDGVDLLVCSAYRPYESQKRNFDNSVESYVAAGYSREDAIAATKRLIAEPGTSEHQTGLAMDIVTPSYQVLDDGYADTAAAKWLLEHAAEYGFILRYPKDKTEWTKIDFEPWHYRYVGVDAAKEIMANGLSLEEYLEG